MKYYLLHILTAVIAGIFLGGCSELEDNISQPQNKISVHKPGILTPGNENFHGNLVKGNNWSMKECQDCHGVDFSGGKVNETCLSCHTGEDGPESCNTCHGAYTDPSRIAPPTDLDNNSSPALLSVGAHAKHLYENTMGNRARCGSCHVFPQSVNAEGHIDDGQRAEVVLKNQATAFGADEASYNPADGTCANTYCHGNFEFYRDSAAAENRFAYTGEKMTGIKTGIKWTETGANKTECGSCHGLPPAGHIEVPLTSCYTCHGDVVDDQGNIIDKTKHINGEVDARGRN